LIDKLLESLQSNYRLYSTLQKEKHDITKYGYWKTNPYFQTLDQLKEYFEKW